MFYAREKELALIGDFLRKDNGSIMIYGKCKVGKTTLLTHAQSMSKDKTVYYECVNYSVIESPSM